jgi:hypothetical protein
MSLENVPRVIQGVYADTFKEMKANMNLMQRSSISLPFLGNKLIPEQAEKIAIGQMDPCTKQLFNLTQEMVFGKSLAKSQSFGKGML